MRLKDKFRLFSGDELHMLNRQAAESSWNIVMNSDNSYSAAQKKLHGRLLNSVVEAIKERGDNE